MTEEINVHFYKTEDKIVSYLVCEEQVRLVVHQPSLGQTLHNPTRLNTQSIIIIQNTGNRLCHLST